MFKPHPDYTKGLLGLFGAGLFFLIVSRPGAANNANNPPATWPLWLGLMLIFFGILGFVVLHLVRQPKSENSLVDTLQDMLRPLVGADDQLPSQPPSPLNEVAIEDEQKLQAAQERYRRDIRFETGIKLGKDFHTLEEIFRWRKEQRASVHQDTRLTAEEKDELLDRIEAIVQREKRQLTNDDSVYEED